MVGTRLTACFAAVLVMSLGGCGGFGASDQEDGVGQPGGGSSPGLNALTIVTTSIPAGSEGAGYGEELEADNARGQITWRVSSGQLPAGVTLSDDGMVYGMPTNAGFYPFTVSATDGVATDFQPLALSVDAFGAFVVQGLHFGEAWSGDPVGLQTVGHAGEVTFEVIANESGGALVDLDAARGSASYVPGTVGAQAAIDTIRMTDTASGESTEITFTVRSNPLQNHIARWGTTDVWYVDTSKKYGSHAYASDFHAALVEMGLRHPDSTDALGTEADQLAELVARVLLHRHINGFFLRETDGSAGVAGLAISLAFDEPGPSFMKPVPGSWLNANAGVYSVISVVDTAVPGLLGTAFLDSSANELHENNTPSGAGVLGVFVNTITKNVGYGYNAYGNTLKQDPVSAADVPALKALLFETPNPGGRHHILEYKLNGLARSLAAVTAHEIAHSLGRPHTTPVTPGSIMNAGTPMAPSSQYAFLPHDIAGLRLALPGPSRFWAQATAEASAMPQGGVCVCNLRGAGD